MSALRCPACHFRLVTPLASSLCPNCEQPLASLLSSPGQSYSPSSPVMGQAMGRSQPPPFSSATTDPEIVVVSASPHPASPSPSKGRQPHSFWRGTSLQGTVLSIQTQQEAPLAEGPDFIAGAFKILRDILWPVAETSQHLPGQGHTTTQIRLRLGDGSQRDVRLQGRIVGANIALGDEISLSGHYRKGTLLAQRGYNQTCQAAILTRSSASTPLPLLLLSLVALAVALWLLLTQWPPSSWL